MRAIEVRDLTTGHGDLRAVDGTSPSVGAGGLVEILGPNGAGQTTLLETRQLLAARLLGWETH